MPDDSGEERVGTSAEIMDIINSRIAGKHWFGEGAGDSGQEASISLGLVNIESDEDITFEDLACKKVVYSYEIVRKSEDGGSSEFYLIELVLDELQAVVYETELECHHSVQNDPGPGSVEPDPTEAPEGLQEMLDDVFAGVDDDDDDGRTQGFDVPGGGNPLKLCEYADSLYGLVQDSEQARDLLNQAEKLIEDPNNDIWTLEEFDHTRSSLWRELAGYWIKLTNDRERALKCLNRSREVATNSLELVELAKPCNILGFDEEAKGCLTDAEEMADSTSDHICIAGAWKEMFEDAGHAIACLDTAMKGLEEPADLRSIALTWMDLLDDRERAKEALKQSEINAKHFDDLVWTTMDWIGVLEDRDRGQQCMEMAENQATTSSDWSRAAGVWKMELNDPDRALRCLKEAERKADTVHELSAVGRDWASLFDDNETGLECLTKAETKAETYEEFFHVGLEMLDSVGDETGAKRCLVEAEKKATKPWEWDELAQLWKRLKDAEGFSRCLERKEDDRFPK